MEAVVVGASLVGALDEERTNSEQLPMDADTGRGMRLVLGSGSPRRVELMRAFSDAVEIDSPARPEGPRRDGETPVEMVSRLSKAKAEEVADRAGDAVVLAADTQVVLDGESLGKPADGDDAVRMLEALRGRSHVVVTGVTLLDAGRGRMRTSVRPSDVTMRRYSDAEIWAYVATGDPLDKAGAYAVQHGEFRPASVRGCYLNVVGLPLCDVVSLADGMGAGLRVRPGWRPPPECVGCPLDAGAGRDRR